MSYAFSETVVNAKWNSEVVEYLTSKFNSVNPRIMVLSNSVFINATLANFDDVGFIINAAGECLELSFAKVDTDKMQPVIQAILNWEAFAKHASAFYVKVDKDTSRSILFDNGNRQGPNEFKSYFHNYETKVTRIKDK